MGNFKKSDKMTFVSAQFYKNNICCTGRINLSGALTFHNTVSWKNIAYTVLRICLIFELLLTNTLCAFVICGPTSSSSALHNFQVSELLNTVGSKTVPMVTLCQTGERMLSLAAGEKK